MGVTPAAVTEIGDGRSGSSQTKQVTAATVDLVPPTRLTLVGLIETTCV